MNALLTLLFVVCLHLAIYGTMLFVALFLVVNFGEDMLSLAKLVAVVYIFNCLKSLLYTNSVKLKT